MGKAPFLRLRWSTHSNGKLRGTALCTDLFLSTSTHKQLTLIRVIVRDYKMKVTLLMTESMPPTDSM